jgi:hypothetical protein
MTASELRDALTALAATARMSRIPNWSATIEITVGARPWVTCHASGDGIVITEGRTQGVKPTTVTVRTDDGLRSWLLSGIDYTHLVRSGEMTIKGNYFDVLLLSKALGLRPEKVAR